MTNKIINFEQVYHTRHKATPVKDIQSEKEKLLSSTKEIILAPFEVFILTICCINFMDTYNEAVTLNGEDDLNEYEDDCVAFLHVLIHLVSGYMAHPIGKSYTYCLNYYQIYQCNLALEHFADPQIQMVCDYSSKRHIYKYDYCLKPTEVQSTLYLYKVFRDYELDYATKIHYLDYYDNTLGTTEELTEALETSLYEHHLDYYKYSYMVEHLSENGCVYSNKIVLNGCEYGAYFLNLSPNSAYAIFEMLQWNIQESVVFIAPDSPAPLSVDKFKYGAGWYFIVPFELLCTNNCIDPFSEAVIAFMTNDDLLDDLELVPYGEKSLDFLIGVRQTLANGMLGSFMGILSFLNKFLTPEVQTLVEICSFTFDKLKESDP